MVASSAIPFVMMKVDPCTALPFAAGLYALNSLAVAFAAGSGPSVLSVMSLCVGAGLVGAAAPALWVSQAHLNSQYAPTHLLNKYTAFVFFFNSLSGLLGP